MTHHTAEQAKEQHVAAMGEPLGRVYDELQQERWRLHSLWNEFMTLYGHRPERIDLTEHCVRHFFRVVQDTLWECWCDCSPAREAASTGESVHCYVRASADDSSLSVRGRGILAPVSFASVSPATH